MSRKKIYCTYLHWKTVDPSKNSNKTEWNKPKQFLQKKLTKFLEKLLWLLDVYIISYNSIGRIKKKNIFK